MSATRILYHLARADFLERIRRLSVLVTLAAACYGAYIFVPPNHARYATLAFDGHRGLYNSAWVGSQVAMLTVAFLLLTGFYLVNNAVARDRRTGVGQIIAATPVRRMLYTVGKALSNFAVLAMIVVAIAAVAGIMQWVRGEDRTIDPIALAVPFIYMVLPVIAVIASVAVLFETLPVLRGRIGNVAYFFLAMFLLSSSILERGDLGGYTPVMTSMRQACAAAYSDYDRDSGNVSLGIVIGKGDERRDMTTFHWDGVTWTAGMFAGRLQWIGLALFLSLLAGLFFDRFDTTRARPGTREHPQKPKHAGWLRRGVGAIENLVFGAGDVPISGVTGPHVHLTPLTESSPHSQLFRTLRAEWKLALRGQTAWWYLGTLALIVVGASVPLASSRQIVLPLAWLWPILVWSSLGNREVRQGTNQLVFSAAHPLRRQLPATWLVGALVALLVGSGVGLRLILGGQWTGVFSWITGAMFIPSLALALGTWSGTRKLFEVVYLFWWYVGPLNHAPGFDFTGATGDAAAFGISAVYLLLSMALLGLAFVGRKRQLAV